MRRSAFAIALAALAGCASSDTAEPIREKAVAVVAARATVTAIDRPQRRVTLRGADGAESAFYADEAVRNFDQIQIGDQLVGELVTAILLEVREPTPDEAKASVLEVVAAAEPGHRPAGLLVHRVTAVLRIEAIDRAAGTATLLGPAGVPRQVQVRDRALLDRVRVGEAVVITYTEALKLAVVPPEGAPTR
jgi:hypothetical protein